MPANSSIPIQTKITTKYSTKKHTPKDKGADGADTPAQEARSRASLVVKTYDPVSGVTLKYRTTKAQEVTRLVGTALARLSRPMAGVPNVSEEEMTDAPAAEEDKPQSQQQQQQPSQSSGGGGKKKKKGKK